MMEKQEYVYNAVVVSIYDADTIRVDIDLGFNHWIHDEPLRLMGIDAPEIRGVERTAGLASRDWLRGVLPIGSKIVILTVRDTEDKYGRYLADIYIGDLHVNAELVRLGLAEIYLP